MNTLKFPKSKDADICLILEGTYPFVGGGVSHWVNELIKLLDRSADLEQNSGKIRAIPGLLV